MVSATWNYFLAGLHNLENNVAPFGGSADVCGLVHHTRQGGGRLPRAMPGLATARATLMAVAGDRSWCQPAIEGLAAGIVDQWLAGLDSPSLPCAPIFSAPSPTDCGDCLVRGGK